MSAWTAELVDAQATHELGEALGASLPEGSVLALCGPLGAGKTTLAQGLARGLGVPPSVRVRSPTFTVCNELAGRVPMLHLDLYRIGDPEEVEDLAAWERAGYEGVTVIEWADLFPELLPETTRWLQLEHDGDRRRVTWWGPAPPPGPAWEASAAPRPGA